jgi:branched-chain amino acid transport system permease protein
MTRSRLTQTLPWLAIALLAALPPLVLNPYLLYLLALGLTYAVLSIGFTIVLGWSGQLAFISVAYFGLGAFSAGSLAWRLGLPAELTIAAALVTGLIAGAAFGALVVRLHRYYMAIATLALVVLLDYGYRNFPAFTGGVSGFSVPSPSFAVLLGGTVTTPVGQYAVGLVLLAIAYAVGRWLQRSQLGRAWRVIRLDPRVAQSLGINVYRSRLLAFTIASGFMAAAGGWFVYIGGRFLPETYHLDELLFHFLILVVGGLGTLRGAVIGALSLVFVREYLRSFPGASEIIFGAVLLLTVLFLPTGLYGALAARVRRLRESVT